MVIYSTVQNWCYITNKQHMHRRSPKFFHWSAKSTFCLPISICWWYNGNGSSHNALPFPHHKENDPCYGNSLKNVLRWQQGFFSHRVKVRPVTSLGHQEGRRVFREGPKFFELCPTHLSRGAKILLRGDPSPYPPGYGPGKSMGLTAISSHCLAALPATDVFNSHMRLNAYYRNLKWTFVAMLLLHNEGQF